MRQHIIIGGVFILILASMLLYVYKPASFVALLSRVDGQDPLQLERRQRIEEMQERVKNAPSLSDEATRKRLLADAVVVDDLPEGYRMLREVAQTEGYPALERALAVQIMGDVFLTRTGGSLQVAEENIFVGEPFATFITASETNSEKRVWDGLARLYEYSYSLSPTPISAYRIAQWHLYNNDVSAAREWFERGEQQFEPFSAEMQNRNYMLGMAHWLRGMIAGELSNREENITLDAESEESFAAGRNYFTSASNASSTPEHLIYMQLTWNHYYNAMFLIRRGLPEDQVTIRQILSEVARINSFETGALRNTAFIRYLTRLGSVRQRWEPTRSEKEAVLKLAEMDATFGAFVRKAGWAL